MATKCAMDLPGH